MDIAKHIRIFEVSPSDDFTTKRTTAIRAIRTAFAKITVTTELLQLAAGLAEAGFAGGALGEELQTQIFGALKKQSPSLVVDDCAVEMAVSALLAAGELIEQAGNNSELGAADILALGLWLAVDLLPAADEPKLEQLRSEIQILARGRVLTAAQASRDRSTVPDLRLSGEGAVTGDAAAKAIAPVVEALRANAALDREELDLLWWLYADRSELIGARLLALDPVVRAIAVGIEIGSMMRRVPSQAYRNLALRDVDTAMQLTLGELLATLGDHRAALAASFADFDSVANAAAVFPLLSSLREGSVRAGIDGRARSLGDWTARALLERSALQVQFISGRRK